MGQRAWRILLNGDKVTETRTGRIVSITGPMMPDANCGDVQLTGQLVILIIAAGVRRVASSHVAGRDPLPLQMESYSARHIRTHIAIATARAANVDRMAARRGHPLEQPRQIGVASTGGPVTKTYESRYARRRGAPRKPPMEDSGMRSDVHSRGTTVRGQELHRRPALRANWRRMLQWGILLDKWWSLFSALPTPNLAGIFRRMKTWTVAERTDLRVLLCKGTTCWSAGWGTEQQRGER